LNVRSIESGTRPWGCTPIKRGHELVHTKSTMLSLLYNFLLVVGMVLSLPITIVSALTFEKRQKTILKRLGIGFCPNRFSRRPVWLHAISVGEILSAIPLAQSLKSRFPDYPLVVSASTHTGLEIAKKRLSKTCDAIFLFPYDFIWSVKKMINGINPAIFILFESDIWPNFLFEMKKRGIPVLFVNGRISPRSFKRYKKISFFMVWALSNFSRLCMQTQKDADRFATIGAPRERIQVTGNIKFDLPTETILDKERIKLKESLGIGENSKILLAGSTHAGEEKCLTHPLKELKQRFSELVILIVPRHPQRAGSIKKLLAEAGLSSTLKTALKPRAGGVHTNSPGIIIVDTLGELRRLYAIADTVFVGGSLIKHGGHNPIEPAMFKKPILFGPHMHNFEWIANTLVRSKGAVMVEDAEDFLKAATRLLADPKEAKTVGEQAYKVLQKNRGAVEKTLKVIEEELRHRRIETFRN
jgi:3-deoxy-D-manno-octulosonic-acid transferase